MHLSRLLSLICEYTELRVWSEKLYSSVKSSNAWAKLLHGVHTDSYNPLQLRWSSLFFLIQP